MTVFSGSAVELLGGVPEHWAMKPLNLYRRCIRHANTAFVSVSMEKLRQWSTIPLHWRRSKSSHSTMRA